MLFVLNPVKPWRHVVVGASAVVAPGLVALGLLGGGIHDERYEAKQIVVAPIGDDGVRITETVDDDFGTVQRHGYQRLIPNDFGVPQDVVATAPHAADDLSVTDEGYETRIRIGDPDITYTGQHRYVLSYTLPKAQISTGQLALDISDNQTELETGRLEIIVTGFELTNPVCQTGDVGATGGCELVRDGDVYRAVIEPLAPHKVVTIRGTITALSEPLDIAVPAAPKHRDDNSAAWALALCGLGALAAGGGFLTARRLGRDEVGGATAADAAFAGGSARLVTDAELDNMATTEFEAPRGLRPWQGTMLLTEKVGSNSVSAWFSDLIAQEALVLSGDSPQVLSRGPKSKDAPPDVQAEIDRLFSSKEEIPLGKYQPKLASLWTRVQKDQVKAAKDSGWWTKFPPGTSLKFPKLYSLIVGAAMAILAVCVWQHWLRAWSAAIVATFAIPAYVAGKLYRRLLPVRSAEGSALALRAESFRRFLEASEGKHVDWAWKHDLLREYSAWAVALGAADAWGRAIASSTVPPAQQAALTMPLVMHTNSGEWMQSRSQPSSSGSSGGGFSSSFSSGGGGGGGGGGSSNW